MRVPPTIEEFRRAMAEMPPVLTIQVSPAVAMTIVAQLQLALRHPGNPPHSAAIAREFINAVRDEFPPTLQGLCDLGDDPQFDVPI